MRPSHLVRALALALCAGACAGTGSVSDRNLAAAIKPVPAGVTFRSDVTEYVVTGRTIPDLVRAMREKGNEFEGRRFAGTAKSSISWRWEYESHLSRCSFKDVTVTVVSQVDMPRWVRDSTADARTVAWWDAMEKRLFEHEVGHIRISRDAAKAIRESTRLLTDASCDQLGHRANRTAQDILAKSREAQADYDRRTAHGTRPDSTPPRPR